MYAVFHQMQSYGKPLSVYHELISYLPCYENLSVLLHPWVGFHMLGFVLHFCALLKEHDSLYTLHFTMVV